MPEPIPPSYPPGGGPPVNAVQVRDAPREDASDLFNRVVLHWKTTAAGVLVAAGAVFGSIHATNPTATWVVTATGIVGTLSLLLAKDK